jgi:PAS domain S-box-containing protein
MLAGIAHFSKLNLAVSGESFYVIARAKMNHRANQDDSEVTQLNRELEDHVKRRTAQLEAANVELQREIAERIRAEQALKAHRQELQDYIDSMSTLNAKVALDGTLLLVNQIAQQAFGLSPEVLMKTNFLDGQWWAFDPNVQARVREAFAKACAGISINYDEKLFVFGKVIDINFSLIPVRNPNGEVAFIVAEGRDISSLKKAESAVAERTAALELANAELEAFSYSVSHDLRAPLRAIEGFATALEEDAAPQLDEQARGYLTRIRNGVNRMNQLIEGLLNLSRVSRRELTRTHFSLTDLAGEIVAELKDSAPDRNATFVVEPDLNTFADRQLLRIVLGNLIGNAWKFSAKNKTARIEFGEKSAAGQSAFFVRDNGAGFEMEYKDKLFKVFQRLHSVEEYEGTGIGLATVQRIIRRHGGRAWAEGEPGKGATFYFTLPEAEFSI